MSDYEQTLLFVSHDRYFIEKFATRIWALAATGRITDFRGGYRDYCQWKSRQQVYVTQAEKRQEREKKPKPQRPKNNDRAIARLEREIQRLEEKSAELDRLSEEHAHRLPEADGDRLPEGGAGRAAAGTV